MNEDVATIGWSQPAAADHQIVMDGATTTLTPEERGRIMRNQLRTQGGG